MAFTITAELPLGTYRGAGADGRVERIPSVSRLYSALLCAAGLGPRAVSHQDRMGPCEADEIALRWLEENPPDAVSLPAIEVNTGNALAYRDDGTIKKSKTSMNIKKLGKHPDVSVAVAGAFRWTWQESPPAVVVAAIEALCPDVPYLGTTESPVRLVTTRDSDVEASHVLDTEASLFAGGGEDVELPVTGRFDELGAAHAVASGRAPSVAKDRFSSDESSWSQVPPRKSVALARYRPVQAPPADIPWPHVLLLPLDRQVDQRDRVGVAVATHRALISIIGYGAPPLITGVYPTGARPVNRLAIQIIGAHLPVDLPAHAPAAVALLIPKDATPSDLDALIGALPALTSIRSRGRVYRITGVPHQVPGGSLWHPLPAGASMMRLWRTEPAAVPDTRGAGDGVWTFGHAAMVSLGFVWKAQLPRVVASRGDNFYRGVVDGVNSAGVVVVEADPVRGRVENYFHRVNDHAVVRPYTATLWLGNLSGERGVVAIGQTRHLGGGLLVPWDVPEGTSLDVSVGTTSPGAER